MKLNGVTKLHNSGNEEQEWSFSGKRDTLDHTNTK